MNLCEVCGLPRSSQHKRWCIFSKKEIEEVRHLYEDGLSPLKIIDLGFNKTLVQFSLRGRRRSLSKSMKIAHKLYSENFKHSEQTKERIRKIKIEFYKNNPEAGTRWKQQSISYPEKVFQQLIQKNSLTKKYDIVREYSFFPYFVDFAFVNIKLAVEIDGSQHWTIQSKIDRDQKKDKLLISNGWKVYRVPVFLLKKQFEKVECDFLQYLQSFKDQPKQFIYNREIIENSLLKKQQQEQKQQLKQQKQQKRQKIKDELQRLRIEKVCNSKIDFSSFGWVKQVAELIDIWPQKVNRWMKKYMSDFFKDKCFKKAKVFGSSPNKPILHEND